MTRLVITLVAVGLIASTGASAQTVDLGTSGFWYAFATRTSDGIPLCGIRTVGSGGRMFFIKWFKGSEDLTVQIFKEGWAVPPNVSADVVMRFDRSAPWSVSSKRLGRTANLLEFTIKHDTVRSFTRSFTQSEAMTIDYPGGSEPSWDTRLTGNSVAINTLAQCVTTMAGQGDTSNPYAYVWGQAPPSSGATAVQPFASTQPFATAQQPPAQPLAATQPFKAEPAPRVRKTFEDEFAGPLKGLQE